MGSEHEIVKQNVGTVSVADMKQQVQHIQKLMSEVMQEDVHYGVIPGTYKKCSKCEGKGKNGDKTCVTCSGTGNEAKPTLLKPGAEKLCMTFRLDPEFEVTERYEDTGESRHLDVTSKCIIYHIPSGMRMGSGFGSCSTREKKYAYRDAQRKCPACGKEAIIKGKDEYGGGWLCFAKKGGCGAKYPDGSPEIESQQAGQVPNPDLPDLYNTILKMANKRSLTDAVLKVTAASDIFTQDLEETATVETKKPEPKPAEKPKTPQAGPTQAQKPAATVAPFDAKKEYTPEDIKNLVGSLPVFIKKLMYSIGVDNPESAWDVYKKCGGDIEAIKQYVNEKLKEGAASK